MSVVNQSVSLTNQRIQRLSEQLANQIAAGEVVERPASVLKELMENAVDAGATAIEVEVEKGGMRIIRIRDNGRGIHSDDLPLAIQRHATSKIQNLEQLHNVSSMGFRGEALASIGSVSRLQLTSRTADSEMAWRVRAEGSEQSSDAEPSAFTVGTLVEVADLFYNTPARRRFLRTEQTEYRHLEDVFKRMALSRMDVAMKLKHNQRLVYQLPEAMDRPAQEKRIAKLCGKGFIQQARYLEFEHGPYRLHGWLGNPGYSRSMGDVQYCFLNQRAIRDKLVSHAIRQATADYIEEGRYPAYVLFFELPASEVDVNVHPTKHEVRFHESRMVHDFLVAALRRALYSVSGDESHISPMATEPVSVTRDTQALESTIRVSETDTAAYVNSHQEYTLLPGHVAWLKIEGLDYLCHLENLLQQEYQRHLTNKELSTKPLLIPHRLSLPRDKVAAILDCLLHYQFDAGQVSVDTIIIRAIPDNLYLLDLEQFCQQLAQQPECPDNQQLTRLAAQCSDYEHEGIQSLVQNQFAQRNQLSPAQQQRLFLPLGEKVLPSLFPGRSQD